MSDRKGRGEVDDSMCWSRKDEMRGVGGGNDMVRTRSMESVNVCREAEEKGKRYKKR